MRIFVPSKLVHVFYSLCIFAADLWEHLPCLLWRLSVSQEASVSGGIALADLQLIVAFTFNFRCMEIHGFVRFFPIYVNHVGKER